WVPTNITLSGSLVVSRDATWVGQRFTRGTSNAKVASFNLTASSAGDVKVSSVQVSCRGCSYSSQYGFDLGNVKLWSNGTQIGNTASFSSGAPTLTFNPSSLTIPRGATVNLVVTADILNSTHPTNNSFYIELTKIDSPQAVNGIPVYGPSNIIEATSSVLAPKISYISQSSAYPGEEISLHGSNFVTANEQYPYVVMYYSNGSEAKTISPNTKSAGMLTFSVPSDLAPGGYSLKVTLKGSNIPPSNEYMLTILSPVVDKTYHPADTNKDLRITISELTAYGNKEHAASASNIWRNGEYYKWSGTDWVPTGGLLLMSDSAKQMASTLDIMRAMLEEMMNSLGR
ncbi:MAG: hypothetical protein AB1589_44400, partial [Cyanobacteriota bacterium]